MSYLNIKEVEMSEKNSKNTSDELWVYDFTEESAQRFRYEMRRRNKINSDKPIIVYIDSYGGYVDALAKMIETMEEISNPKITVAMGKAMSCGAILLSHGDIRYCGQHSRTMVHEVSAGTEGNVHDMKNDTYEVTRLNNHFMSILAKNCGIKGGYAGLRKILKNRDGNNIWMSAQESCDFGLVDFVGTPKLNTIPVHNIDLVSPRTRKHLPLKIKNKIHKKAKNKTHKKTKRKIRKKTKRKK